MTWSPPSKKKYYELPDGFSTYPIPRAATLYFILDILSAAMYEPLISKIHKGWKSSTLSYACRSELKKSDLNAFLSCFLDRGLSAAHLCYSTHQSLMQRFSFWRIHLAKKDPHSSLGPDLQTFF